MDRNNTSFSIKLFEYLKNVKIDSKWNFLKYYQNIVRVYMLSNDIGARGLLLYHSMGMGKSIEAVAIAMEFIDERQPIILLTKSLQDNFHDNIIKYMKLRSKYDPEFVIGTLNDKDLKNYINKKFSFVSMNASNMMKQMLNASEGTIGKEMDKILSRKMKDIVKLGTLDNKLLIIDEAHNLFRAVTNGSQNAKELYDMILTSKNLKIVLLSGTPIANNPFELSVCFNILAGKLNEPILPEDYNDFYKYFVDSDNKVIKNKEKLQNRIMGLVSYISHESTPGKKIGLIGTGTDIEFPKLLDIIIRYIPMSQEQYVIYLLARDKELEEKQKYPPHPLKPVPSMQKPRDMRSSSYRVKSRQISNYSPGSGYMDKKFAEINPLSIPENRVTSPKLVDLYKNIIESPGLNLVYSQFIGIGGLGIIARFLEINGWKRYIIKKETPVKFIVGTTIEEKTGGNELDGNELDGNELDGNELGGNELGGNELGSNELGGNELGGNELGGNELGGNELGGNELGGNELDGNELGGRTIQKLMLSSGNDKNTKWSIYNVEENMLEHIKEFLDNRFNLHLSKKQLEKYISLPYHSAMLHVNSNMNGYMVIKYDKNLDTYITKLKVIENKYKYIENYMKKFLEKELHIKIKKNIIGTHEPKIISINNFKYPPDFILNQTAHSGAGEFDCTYMDNIINKLVNGGLHKKHKLIRTKGRIYLSPFGIKHKKIRKNIIIPQQDIKETSKKYNIVTFDVSIRKLTDDDIKKIKKTYPKYKFPDPDNSPSKFHKSPYVSYVAEHIMDNDVKEIIALVILKYPLKKTIEYTDENIDDYIELVYIGVATAYVRFGIGTMLFHKITDLLEKSIVSKLRMYLNKKEQNVKETLEFMKKMGSQIIEETPKCYIIEYNQEYDNENMTGGNKNSKKLNKISESHIYTDESGKKYNINKLIIETKNNEIKEFNPSYWNQYLDDLTWWDSVGKSITPNMVLENRLLYKDHFQRIKNADLSYPIILTPDRQHIIDGVHRLAKCYLINCDTLKCIIATKEQMKKVIIKKIIVKNIKGSAENVESEESTFSAKKTKNIEKYYAVISGNVDIENRQKIQKIFNSNKNKHGEIIDTLLISSTGAEGLDLKNIRRVHIFEPYWNYGRIEQIISRAVRINSHIALSPEEKNVQPYIYISTKNIHTVTNLELDNDKKITKKDISKAKLVEQTVEFNDEYTTDMELLNESMKNQALLHSFLKTIQEVSIECVLNDGQNCKICNPTDIPLFMTNIDLDMIAENPCREFKEEKITVNEIIVDGTTYYYNDDPNSVFGYKIYEYDELIGGYKSMAENDLFQQIIEKINIKI